LLQLPKVLPAARLAELDAALHLTGTRNPEIAERWYPLAERGGHLAARPAMRQFLIAMGRRKLIKPIYEALAQTADGLAFARDAFAQARGGYHPITTAMVEGILARSEAAPASPAAPAAK
ncbi:MAG TPA: leukotriene A4 hydrolase C-terminal domain-containing protein, partial [Kofleriaceae bacterium]|nr:leukotriene A4 hydrolase C-terminal domain-containing protein [Kofleriaceae bacterium]